MAKSKKTKKKVTKAASKNEVVIRVVAPETVPVKPQDLEPIKEKSKYMIQNNWMTEKQVIRLVQKTPEQHIYTRPGKGGGTFTYVTGIYVTKVLNFIFGWNWDFEVLSHGVEGKQVWVHGKLTVKDDKGHTIVKSQFGRADIKYKKDTNVMLDFGNDLKAATTDALKKCASMLGIASDVYGKAEFKQEANVDVEEPVAVDAPKVASPTATIVRPSLKNDSAVRCQVCAKEVSEAEAEYSQRRFGKILCREHQPKPKNK